VRLAFAASILLASATADVVPEIRVTSEFVASGPGREILSPAVPRNGWSSFHVTVQAPPGMDFSLHIAQNPELFARTELYRDGRRVPEPYDGKIPEDATSVTFWLDLFIGSEADVRRFKLEPQAYTARSGWIVYPMEVRVVEMRVPPVSRGREFPSPPKPLDFAANYLCGAKHKLSRNLEQDWRLATLIPRERVELRLKAALAANDSAAWCADPQVPAKPEWYLPFRDFLLGQAK
jgi:hypothetical protein